MELLWRFLLGGAMVSLFALIGDVVRPKRFAGIFGGAPSVALATLALSAAKSGPLTASLEARSMILSSLGFVLYVCVAQPRAGHGTLVTDVGFIWRSRHLGTRSDCCRARP
jgi:hypothetical protein